MGMIFKVNGREIWDRGLRTSQMFCGQVLLLEKLVDTPSGIYDTGKDEVQVDPAALRAFLRAVFAYLDRSGSWPLRAMVRGVVQVGLFLDYRASGDWLAVPDRFQDITDGLDRIT
ncbi:DUF6086 family protein [Micromonospora sp. NPDC047465]|uniref:DUF6086 family protein n=1 Tax=Micromonospora sp. NPDC047465 TaxID=3154813 RepID=UPI0033F7FD91